MGDEGRLPGDGSGKLTRRQFLIAGGLAVGGVTLAACRPEAGPATTTTAPTGTAAPTPSSVSEIVMATTGEAPTLFQNLEYQPQAYSIYDGILEFLCKSDPLQPELGQQPQLAVSWTPVSDTQWEFELRQGVTFHNGEAWNAEAAKANLDILVTIDPPSPVMFRIQPYESCEVKDEFTLIVNTTEPWSMAPVGLSEVQFGAPGYLSDVGPQQFAQAPIGTGMFEFAEWQKGEQIVLERNGEYWGEQALVDRLIFRGIPDAATRFAALRAGEVDVIEDLDVANVEPAVAEGFVIADTPIAQSILMTPYMIDAQADGHPTADPRIRLAMNHAIDRESIIESVLAGFGRLMGGQVTGPDAFGWNPNLTDYPYDPQRARDLLAEAGYPNGIDLGELFVGVPGEFFQQGDFVQAAVAQLADAGIHFTMQEVEYTTFLRMALQEYSLRYWHIGGWQYYPVMDSAFALMWYDSDAFLRTGLGDPEYDEIWRASNREFDIDRRREMLQECHRIIHETPGPVFLWQHNKIFAHNERVQGLRPTPDERIHWTGVSV